TIYRLAESVKEEKKLKIEAEHNKFIYDLESKIIKVCKKIIPKTEGNKIYCWIKNKNECFVTLLIEKDPKLDYNDFVKIWENRGFKVEDRYNIITAKKDYLLDLNDDIDKQIKKVIGV
ncbi:unnamed protein product, partial [marine sediment metagenome]